MAGKRDTGTGSILEQMVVPALLGAGYSVRRGVNIGKRVDVGKHIIDIIAERDGKRFLLSMKWQQVKGTAEQKVPFEVICLIEALEMEKYDAAYLVLGGEGWTLRDFYRSGGLERYLKGLEKVHIHSFESFVGLLNQGDL